MSAESAIRPKPFEANRRASRLDGGTARQPGQSLFEAFRLVFITLPTFVSSKIYELLQIENSVRHVLPYITALEEFIGRNLMKTRHFFRQPGEPGALCVIRQSSERGAKHRIEPRFHGWRLLR